MSYGRKCRDGSAGCSLSLVLVTASCYCGKAAKPKIMIGIISLVGRFKGWVKRIEPLNNLKGLVMTLMADYYY